MMAKLLTIEEETIGEIVVLHLRGELDMKASNEVQKRIQRILDSGHKKIIVDLKELRYISSSGVAVFILMTGRAINRGGGLKLAGLAGQVRDTFRVLHLHEGDPMMNIHSSVEEATKDFND